MAKVFDESFVTLATNENYAIGALTLGYSLRKVNTNRMLTVMISKEVPEDLRRQLGEVFDKVEIVDLLNSNDVANLSLLKRPELGVTFTKLHCWRLTQFKKAVFLDADCLVLKNVDELFDREEFSASTDVGWPDCFNSGVFVFKPSGGTYTNLVNFALQQGSFDGGDQGLLNSYFSDWSTAESSRRLPFIYNMTTNVSYSYAPAFKQFREGVKIVHFIGAQKPWYYRYNLDTNTLVGNVTNQERDHLSVWWNLFVESVLPKLSASIKTKMSTQLIHSSSSNVQGNNQTYQTQQFHATSESYTPQQSEHSGDGGVVVGSNLHQNMWESGQIEYTGRDSFSNIQAHLDAQLKK